MVTFVCAIAGLMISGASLGSGKHSFTVLLYLMGSVCMGCLLVCFGRLGELTWRCLGKNALTLVGFWLVFVVVLPGVSEVVVDTVYPPPSQVELLHEAREAAQAVEKS